MRCCVFWRCYSYNMFAFIALYGAFGKLLCAARAVLCCAALYCAWWLQVLKCKELGRAMRIGTNHGSLSARILSFYGDTPRCVLQQERLGRAEAVA